MTTEIPGCIAEITADWLSAAVGSTVRTFHCETVGEGIGFLSELARLTIDYAPGETGPRTVVAKLPALDATNRALASQFNYYEHEVCFYRDIGAHAGIRVPRCYSGVRDARTGAFALVLEDLGAGRVCDQLDGLSLEDASIALRDLAGLHATWWNSPKLAKFDWLSDFDETMLKAAEDIYRAVLPQFIDRYGRLLTAAERRLAETMADHFLDFFERMYEAPRTISHGDYRVDNFVFEPDRSHGLAILDWQCVTALSGGAWDVAYFLAANVDPHLRRDNLSMLLRTYYDHLLRGGVEDYSYHQLSEDMRFNALGSAARFVMATALEPANDRGARLLERMVLGTFGLTTDVDAAAVL